MWVYRETVKIEHRMILTLQSYKTDDHMGKQLFSVVAALNHTDNLLKMDKFFNHICHNISLILATFLSQLVYLLAH